MTSTGEQSAERATSGISRRGVLAAGAVGAAGVALAACAKAPSPDNPTVSGPAPSAAGGSASSSGSAGSGSSASLAKLSSIPVGGAVSATGPNGAKIVIARPATGQVAAFSAICTHQGCVVVPAGNQLDCPCHGSVYNAATGAVITGPAPRPLPAVSVKISGDDIIAG